MNAIAHQHDAPRPRFAKSVRATRPDASALQCRSNQLGAPGLLAMRVLVIAAATLAIPCHASDAASDELSKRSRLEQAIARFDQAVALKDHDSPAAQRLYAESLERFESVLLDGVDNGDLHYNAGNAALRLGRIGEAIAHYKQAERLIPGDRDLARNLAFARRLCSLHVESNASNAITDTLLFWYRDSTTRARWIVAACAYVLFWSLLLFRLRLNRPAPALFWTSLVAAMIALATGASVGYDALGYGNGKQGVVVRNDTVLRKGNGEGYQPQLENPLPDGVEFRITEVRDSADGDRWLRIELPDGTDGWINGRQAIVI